MYIGVSLQNYQVPITWKLDLLMISSEVKQLVLKYNRNITISSMLHSSEVKCYQYPVLWVGDLQQ